MEYNIQKYGAMKIMFSFLADLKNNLNRDKVIVFLSLIILIISFALAVLPKSSSDLDILTDLQSADNDNFIMKGTVINDGKPVDSSLVWIVLRGEHGNERSPSPNYYTTGDEGEFVFREIPKYISGYIERKNVSPAKKPGNNEEEDKNNETTPKGSATKSVSEAPLEKVQEISVFAKSLKSNEEGEKIMKITDAGTRRVGKIDYRSIAYLPIIFLMSIFFPFIIKSNKIKYLSSIIGAFLLSGGMILTIGIGIYYISSINLAESLSLGFAHIAKFNNEWALSLTSPSNSADGFWVPLWVLLISVVGASLFTVSIIVTQIKERPDFSQLDNANPDSQKLLKFNTIIEKIVRHQFYMFFSPIGSIFVYQLLVAAKAANQPVTIAIAALGSAPMLNMILDKAINATESLVGKEKIASKENK